MQSLYGIDMKSNRLLTICLVLMGLLGLALFLYPSVSDYWNAQTQSRAMVDYQARSETFSAEEKESMLGAAEAYNEALNTLDYPFSDYSQIEGQEGILPYDQTLLVSSNGVIGSINIRKIGINMPIYHGVSEDVLRVSIGHLPGSSLPVGGEGTHTVLSAHRGLPTAKLFTDLDQLDVGDTFTITVLGRTLTYEVDRISTVLPHEVEYLYPEEGKDLCTLVTCTPYGVNTHRLLVRGHRIDGAASTVVTADAAQVESSHIAATVAITCLVAAALAALLPIGHAHRIDYPEALRKLSRYRRGV